MGPAAVPMRGMIKLELPLGAILVQLFLTKTQEKPLLNASEGVFGEKFCGETESSACISILLVLAVNMPYGYP